MVDQTLCKDQKLAATDLLSGAIVKILVGPEKKVYNLHEDLLCARSTYFKNMFQGQFVESTEKIANLIEDDVAAFDLFVVWIYGTRHSLVPCKDDNGLRTHLKLYILASKLCIPRLENTVINLVGFYLKNCPERSLRLEHVVYTYQNTTSGSKMRKLLVVWVARTVVLGDSTAMHANAIEMFKEHTTLATDVLARIYRQHMKIRSPSIQNTVAPHIGSNNCEFHRHLGGMKCTVNGTFEEGFGVED